MQSYLMETICKTGIFIICAQVLIHFRPKASYDKYLKMLVSAMILIQLFMPVSELFAGEKAQTLSERLAWFEGELERRMHETAQSYEMQIKAFEEDTQVETESLWKNEIVPSNLSEKGKISVAPIAPITQISIEKGDEEDADISSGDNR